MRTVDKYGDPVENPDLSKGYLRETVILKEDAPELSSDHPCYTDDDYELGYTYFEGEDPEIFFKQVQKESEQKAKKEEKLMQVADLIQFKTEQSDKLGYIWKCTYVGDICVSKEYIEDPDATGTKDNPIIWKPGVQLIPNAFYIYNDITYVYVGEASEAGNEFDFSNFEQM